MTKESIQDLSASEFNTSSHPNPMDDVSSNNDSAVMTHSEEHSGGHEEGSPEIPNWITLVKQYPSLKASPKAQKFLHFAEAPIFSFTTVLIISLIVIKGMKSAKIIPNRLQNVIEFFVEKFDGLVCGILGEKNGRRFLPYVGSLFLFIFVNNVMGIIPFMKSSTSQIQTTAALAILTFLYVHYVGFRENGILGYVHHLAGSPRDVLGWILSPFMFVLHIISELAKPVSLALRLFGNILGEDILLGAFVMMGIGLFQLLPIRDIPVGFPLHFPFLFLALLTSTIQALVFSMLATIYFLMVLPHDEEHHE